MYSNLVDHGVFIKDRDFVCGVVRDLFIKDSQPNHME